MCFTGSILISKDLFWSLVQASGGYFFTGHEMPWVHSVVVAVLHENNAFAKGIDQPFSFRVIFQKIVGGMNHPYFGVGFQ